ncbi:MAG: hypothetical protein KGL74_00515 [Elusimicrobia bacterium]|nr:hypothetical protein [Elusimicrobiota bacterium]MDE2509577.1 hypothetical protein [Elusimicrobiota bacterium]
MKFKRLFVVLRRRKKALAVVAVVAAAALACRWIPWRELAGLRAERVRDDERRRPWIEEARRLDLTFEKATADCPKGCLPPEKISLSRFGGAELMRDAKRAGGPLGLPVVWCVDHPVAGVSYVSGDPQQVVQWTNESQVPITAPKIDRCARVLAFVRAAKADAVMLEFKAVVP